MKPELHVMGKPPVWIYIMHHVTAEWNREREPTQGSTS